MSKAKHNKLKTSKVTFRKLPRDFHQLNMRKRKIKKIGNSYYVKLEQIDVIDWEKKEGDLVGVVPLDEDKRQPIWRSSIVCSDSNQRRKK